MALFYSNDMPEFKTMKSIYANRVHKFVSDWLKQTAHLTTAQRHDAWNTVSRTKLGNLMKPDMLRPKKYKNKYICFCEVMRPLLKAAHPEKPIKEITHMMGARWKTFSADKEPELAAQIDRLWETDQKRYLSEKSLSTSLGKERKPQASAYIQFCKQKRTENPKITMLSLASKWKQHKMSMGS